MNKRIFIPTAGIGSRISPQFKNINKSLIPLKGKGIISHIIEKIPTYIEIVVGLGYQADLVREYLELAHPNNKFIFVEVDQYEGDDAGPGRTLLAAKEYLQCPFVFWACDTIVGNIDNTKINNMDFNYNWLGISFIHTDQQSYRTVQTDNEFHFVQRLIDKNIEPNPERHPNSVRRFPYIGLSYIKDYQDFWKNMIPGKICYQMGESFGIQGMLASNIPFVAEAFDWYDTGNKEEFNRTQKLYSDSINVLAKDNENIWFVNDRVIKYHKDKNFITNRVKRATNTHITPFLPKLIDHKSNNMYAYHKEDGEILSNCVTVPIFLKLLDVLQNKFWQTKRLSFDDQIVFETKVKEFYLDKTLQRIEEYFKKYGIQDQEEIINDETVPAISKLINKIDFDALSDIAPSTYHGDLHFENILYQKNTNEFKFLDWRQDFAGFLHYGDVKYDLAKLYHGLIINHKVIKNNQFYFTQNGNKINYDFMRHNKLVECENHLHLFLMNNSYNLQHIRLLTNLIFINNAPLHEPPYSYLLFSLGKYGLSKCI